jgi:hypothetical protein
MADSLIYEISNTTELSGEPFTRKDRVYIIDQNNSSYSNNTIILDSASISNSGKWALFQTATLTIPLLVTMTSRFDFSLLATDFCCGLKNSFTQLVNSINVEYGNSSVIQVSNFTNAYISYKLNTTLDVDSVVTIGSQIGFALDGGNSWFYSNTPTAYGVGSINCDDDIVSTNCADVYRGASGNVGFFRRQMANLFSNSQIGVDVLLGGGWASVASQVQKSYTVKSLIASASGYFAQSWNILATIRLKDLSDIFEKLPLVRGAFVKLYVYLNQSKTTLTIAGTAGQPAITAGTMRCTGQDIQVFGGNTNPLMIASARTAQSGMRPLAQAVSVQGPDQQFVFSVSILNSLDQNCPSPYNRYQGQTSVRLYCDLYTMNPLKEEEYLMTNRTKTVEYRDIFQYQFLNIPTGSFNFLVSNGISDLVEIVCMPIISSTYNGTGNSATSFSPILSPFASEPATCSPCMFINNWNIQISGVNCFINSKQFLYEQFQDELYGVGAVNGGMSDGVNSGLISQLDYTNNYGYLVANVSRRLPEEDRTPKSVQILGNNVTQVPISMYVFCVMRKSIQIDVFTGKRLS